MAALQWYELRSSHGTITIKARYQWEAIQEAAERWNCSEEEIICVAWGPYHPKRHYM